MRVVIDDDRMDRVATHVIIDLIYLTIDCNLLDWPVLQNFYLIFTVRHILELGVICS